MKRWEVRYLPFTGCAERPQTWRCYAYSAEHALERFYDTDPDSGWHVVDVREAA